MHKLLVSLVAIAALVGCSKDTSSNNSSVPVTNGANNSASNSTATIGNDGSAQANNSEESNNSVLGTSTAGQGSTKIKNPDRVYQLDNLETTTIKTPGGDLKLWVMDTEPKRAEGMMMLRDNEVKENEGMIFLFPKVQEMKGNYAFWMHNTILPLDIDYISKDKKVLNIGKGVSFSEAPVKPSGDYFYVIEVKQGLSAKFGLTPGAKVNISNDLTGKP